MIILQGFIESSSIPQHVIGKGKAIWINIVTLRYHNHLCTTKEPLTNIRLCFNMKQSAVVGLICIESISLADSAVYNTLYKGSSFTFFVMIAVGCINFNWWIQLRMPNRLFLQSFLFRCFSHCLFKISTGNSLHSEKWNNAVPEIIIAAYQKLVVLVQIISIFFQGKSNTLRFTGRA